MAKVNIHMVRSVKGGSGKTAFSLRKIVDLSLAGKNALYIDADVHASGTFSRLYKSFSKIIVDEIKPEAYFFQFTNGSYPEESNRHFLNTYIHPYRGYYSKIEEIMLSASLMKLSLVTVTGNDAEYRIKEDEKSAAFKPNFIFSDPSREGRDVFGNIFQSSGRAAIGVGTYIAKMKNLLSYALEQGFTDIVVDMPPGSDTFSEHLADLITSLSGSKHKLSIYYVTTKDLSHLKTSAEAAVAHLHQMKSAYIDEIILVCNEGRDDQPKSSGSTAKTEGMSASTLVETGISETLRPEGGGGDVGDVEKGTISKAVLMEQIKDVCNDCLNPGTLDDELKRINYKLFLRDKLYYNSQRDPKMVTVFDGSDLMIKDLLDKE